jgi:hypothetical protein
MPLNNFSAVCALTQVEHRYLKSLFEDDHLHDTIITQSTNLWLRRFAPEFPDHLDCRSAFLQHSAKTAAESGLAGPEFRSLAAAYALTLAEIVERRVLEKSSKGDISK